VAQVVALVYLGSPSLALSGDFLAIGGVNVVVSQGFLEGN
jgi:hypothetical protein